MDASTMITAAQEYFVADRARIAALALPVLKFPFVSPTTVLDQMDASVAFVRNLHDQGLCPDASLAGALVSHAGAVELLVQKQPLHSRVPLSVQLCAAMHYPPIVQEIARRHCPYHAFLKQDMDDAVNAVMAAAARIACPLPEFMTALVPVLNGSTQRFVDRERSRLAGLIDQFSQAALQSWNAHAAATTPATRTVTP